MFAKKPDRIPSIMAVMTPFPWFIHIEDELERARQVMAEHGIRHLPVTREGELVGVLGDRDVALLESRSDVPPSIRDACVLDAYVVDVTEPLDRVLSTMAERHLDATLVVRNHKLAGIFTASDACRAFAEFLRLIFPPGGTDEAA